MKQLSILLFVLCISLYSSAASKKTVLENELVKIEIDLKIGTYNCIDKATGQVCVKNANWRVDNVLSTKTLNTVESYKIVTDSMGHGKTVVISSVAKSKMVMRFSFTLYDHRPFVIMKGGVKNLSGSPIQVKEISPVENATLFVGSDLKKNFRLVDGEGGGAPTYVRTKPNLNSQNDLIMHFGDDNDYRTLVAGGVSYNEFSKFAVIGARNMRDTQLRGMFDKQLKYVAYYDLGDDKEYFDAVNPCIQVSQSASFKFDGNPDYVETSTVLWSDSIIDISLLHLAKNKPYVVGLSWCDDSEYRKQDVYLCYGDKKVKYLADCKLPSLAKGEKPQMLFFEIPADAAAQNPVLRVKRTSGANVVVSEVVLYEGRLEAGKYCKAMDILPQEPSFDDAKLQLFAADEIGKRIDAGKYYEFDKDLFYLDFTTKNPVNAAETYAATLKKYQNINLNYYYFPTICLWYAMMPIYGGDIVMGTNDAVGAVDEMKRVKDSGFLRYTTMGIRLVPDCYDESNENGWWDDEHWRLHGSGPQGDGMVLKAGHYRAPYETSKSWATAIRDLGGLPFTYFQTAVRSKDYAEAYPEHMLFNESYHKIPAYDWLNRGFATYDFTDAGFIAHMKGVYANLKDAKIAGMMFDYPYTGWPIYGGMDDKYSTAAASYRNIFRLAHTGLMDNNYVHERNLKYGSDIALGYVSSQRTWGDTDVITPEMVARSGLRWYKNRVVVNYDMDAKNLLKSQKVGGEDGINKLLTMSYVTASRLLLANSFGTLGANEVYKLSRIFPYHQFPKSARPLDAFVADYPRVYGMELTGDWMSLTFFNEDEENSKEISISLDGIVGRGGAGLNSNSDYYVYDFWNDCLVGKVNGGEVFTQTLRRGEARQMSVRKALGHPQVLSTDRHILQGFLELDNVKWDASSKTLSGTADLVENEAMNIVVALNGFTPAGCDSNCSSHEIFNVCAGSTVKLCLKNNKSGKVDWKINF